MNKRDISNVTRIPFDYNVVGAYYATVEELYKDTIAIIKPEFRALLPLVSDLTNHFSDNLHIVDVDNRENTLKEWGTLNRDTALNDDVIRDHYIDTRLGDIRASSSKYIINLTDRPIVTVDHNEIVNFHTPDNIPRLKYLGNCIIIFELVSLTTPDVVSLYEEEFDIFGSTIKKLRPYSSLEHISKTIAIYEMGRDLYNKMKEGEELPTKPTIKIPVVTFIEDEDLTTLMNEESIYDPSTRLMISTIQRSADRPFHPNSIIADEYKASSPNTINVYMNDPDRLYGDRYTYAFDGAILIPNIMNRDLPRGLFVSTDPNMNRFDDEGNRIESTKYYTLEEMKDLPYLYKSVEEAMEGADREKLADRSIADMQRRHVEVALEHKVKTLELEKEKLLEEREREREKEEREREARELKLKEEESKAKQDALLELINKNHEENKRYREYQMSNTEYALRRQTELEKWERETKKTSTDNTLQTLKVIGGVLATVAAGITIYGRLNK